MRGFLHASYEKLKIREVYRLSEFHVKTLVCLIINVIYEKVSLQRAPTKYRGINAR